MTRTDAFALYHQCDVSEKLVVSELDESGSEAVAIFAVDQNGLLLLVPLLLLLLFLHNCLFFYSRIIIKRKLLLLPSLLLLFTRR